MKLLSLLFFTIFIVTAFFNNCSSPPDVPSVRTDGGIRERDHDRNSEIRSERVNEGICPAEPQCAEGGSDCCSADSSCAKKCKDYFRRNARTACLKYPISEAEEVASLMKKLSSATVTSTKLKNIEPKSLCYLFDLSPDIWEDEIDGYSSSSARNVLKWLVDENVGQYFGSNEDELQEIVEGLLKQITGGSKSSQYKYLNALVEEEIDNDPILFYLFQNDHTDEYSFFTEHIHNQIIKDQICGDESRRPKPQVASNTQCSPSTTIDRYGLNTAIDSAKTCNDLYDWEDAKNNGEVACMLAVYCYTKNEKKKNHASKRGDIGKEESIDGGEITEFIHSSVYDSGGLNNNDATIYSTSAASGIAKISENDAEDWSNSACENLQKLWNNNEDDNDDNNLLCLGLGKSTDDFNASPPTCISD